MGMQEVADELYDSWVNGNLSWVVDQLCNETPARAAILASLISSTMSQEQRMVFRRMLLDRVSIGM